MEFEEGFGRVLLHSVVAVTNAIYIHPFRNLYAGKGTCRSAGPVS
jgi:hypothetical protein